MGGLGLGEGMVEEGRVVVKALTSELHMKDNIRVSFSNHGVP